MFSLDGLCLMGDDENLQFQQAQERSFICVSREIGEGVT
jgi:hypothetical protein